MRHRLSHRKLNRSMSHRRALLRNQVTDLFQHEHLRTTEAKAKEVRSQAERIITLAKRGSLHARRQALAYVYGSKIVDKLFHELAERYRTRPGGYTRIVKLGERPGDGAALALLELLPG